MKLSKKMRRDKRIKKAKNRMRNRISMSKIDKLEMMILMHFPQTSEDARKGVLQDDAYFERVLTCENCEDYKSRCCSGEGRKGERVMDCMYSKSQDDGEWGFGGKLPFSLN